MPSEISAITVKAQGRRLKAQREPLLGLLGYFVSLFPRCQVSDEGL